MINLYDYQLKAIEKMHNGCVLCGGVGSGKSRTSLAYYYKCQGGSLTSEKFIFPNNPKDLYIITTARKRDTGEWEDEFVPFRISINDNLWKNNVIVDSWNNIGKYKEVMNAFFIFDEQRVVGKGAWVKSFIKIAKANEWILLSATPGDTWMDYVPVFIANGFYKNRTQFNNEHVSYTWINGKYPKIDRYFNVGKLTRLRSSILISMDFERKTIKHNIDIGVSYDILKYREVGKTRWDPYKDEPIQNASGLCYIWRRVVNEDDSRQSELLQIIENHPTAIIFYNFDYELDILRCLAAAENIKYAEWNGHKHEMVPDGKKWLYFVQYTAGSEGWNCITTNCIIFFSQNYSYKIMHQSAGRIDRLNTPFTDLYYYHLKSKAPIDIAISRALKNKKNFQESSFIQF